jgi:peptidoglycan/xylan/chitin deacetylase (PgdA/CDA1 family)
MSIRPEVDGVLDSADSRSRIAPLHSMRPEQSLAVAREVLSELGAVRGVDCFSFPNAGVWRIETLSFQASKITDVILRRPETAIFPVFARFGDHHLTGEAICELSDGTPAITIEDEVLKFGFDPFSMHLSNLNEGFRNSRTSGLKQSALITYCSMPPLLRRGLRWIARRYKMSGIRSLKNLGLLGVSSNVLIHLLERHLLQKGLIGKQNRSPLAIITHDVDTDFCQTEGREMVLSIEIDEEVHATWFFVPKSVHYSLDRRGVRSLIEEGHEIGMHGFSHDGRLALDNPAKLTKQLRKGKRILESTGAKVVSFRSPWTLRSALLLRTLASEGFKVDSSYPDLDTLGMTGGLRGLSYNRPFRPLFAENKSLLEPLPLWEVPMTCPQDVQMVEDLRLAASDLLRIWNYKAEFCKDFGGAFVLDTHPVHMTKHLDEYAEILKTLKKRGFMMLRMDGLADELQSSISS